MSRLLLARVKILIEDLGAATVKGLYHGGQPEFMGSAYPSADTDRISRGGGAAFAGIKFRGVK